MKKLFVTLSALTLSTAAFAEGGSHVGNGGGVWTCRDATPAHALVWVDLVELSEGRREFNLNIPKLTPLNQEQWITQVEDKIKKANPAFFAEYKTHMEEVRAKFTIVKDSDFTRIDDAYHRTAPDQEKFCPSGTIQPEQLANFTTEGHLLINDEIWSNILLSETDRAALYVHEAIYSLLRDRAGAQDSVKTREIVGYLFSDLPIANYAYLLTLPAVTPPLVTVQASPSLGLYHATAGDWATAEITYYNAQNHTLFITEHDNKNGHNLNSHVFRCDSAAPEMTCTMIQTTNSHIGDLNRHHLKVSESETFVWLVVLKSSGVTRATRYRR